MKFLLAAVNAKYIHSNPAVYDLRAYAGAELRSFIDLAEYTINQRMPDILADIYARKPDVIGFSCYIWNWGMIAELIRELPKILPGTDIWLGGPEVTYNAASVLRRYPELAGIMVGEGEATFRELLAWYADRTETERAEHEGREHCERLKDIPGLCLSAERAGAEAPFFTPARDLIDLDELPFPYEDLEPFKNRIIYYESSRGCPFCCSYCLSSVDKKVRFRSMTAVKRELQFFLDNRVKQVKFVDRTFNCSHEHAMEIWRYLYEHDNGVTNFHFEISADILREDEIALLNRFRPGLAQLEIGVQSVNAETIEAVQRVMDVEKLERIVSAIRVGGNIHIHLDLIAGLPYEDYRSFGNSFNRVYAMRPQQLQLGFLKILKGSPMEERTAEYGIACLDTPPYEVLYTKWLTYEEILRLKRIEEMVELYYNSNQFNHTVSFLEEAFESPFAMFERLADYYRQNGLTCSGPARAERYRILLQFAAVYDAKYTEIYRELLTYDLYLRENCKSRPDFSPEQTEQMKSFAREFYRAEERERCYLPAYAAYDRKQLGKMTHLEAFRFPVWDESRMKACRDDANPLMQFVLFDYDSAVRSPLTYEAAVHVIRSNP